MSTALELLFQEINPLKDLAVPAAAALLGIWVATRKFRNEQIWKEKYASYQRVLQSLESISHWASETQSSINMLPTTGTKNISEEFALAQREVLRQASIGYLILSDAFCAELRSFIEAFYSERFNAYEDNYGDDQERDMLWSAHAGKVYELVEKCLPRLIKLARSDLGA